MPAYQPGSRPRAGANVISVCDVPRLTSSAMDGYALRAADAGQLPASPPAPWTAARRRRAARIFAGAKKVRQGADAVVQEQTEAGGRNCACAPRSRWRTSAAKAKTFGRAAWCCLPAHDSTPWASALLRRRVRPTWSCPAARAWRCSRRATSSSCPASRCRPAPSANSTAFAAWACLGPGLRGARPRHRARLDGCHPAPRCEAAAQADLIVTSGGVSVGEDHLRPRRMRAEGKLTLSGPGAQARQTLRLRQVGGSWYVGLPGSPVSSLVTFLLLVRPAVLKPGTTQLSAPQLPTGLPAGFDWPRNYAPRVHPRAHRRRRSPGALRQPKLRRAQLGRLGRWRRPRAQHAHGRHDGALHSRSRAAGVSIWCSSSSSPVCARAAGRGRNRCSFPLAAPSAKRVTRCWPKGEPAASGPGGSSRPCAPRSTKRCAAEAAIPRDGDELAFFPPVTGG